jgi:hypothetical protein
LGDSKENEIDGTCSTYGERRVTNRVFVGKLERKRPLGRPMRRWEDNIEMALGGMDSIVLAQNRDRWRAIVSTVMKLRVP